jgi:hypothetical protein
LLFIPEKGGSIGGFMVDVDIQPQRLGAFDKLRFLARGQLPDIPPLDKGGIQEGFSSPFLRKGVNA